MWVMGQFKFLAAVALAAGMLTSCTIGDDQQATTVAPPPQPIAPSPSPSPAVAPIPAAPVGLIAPTDPNARLKAFKTGRADPFSTISIPESLQSDRLGFKPALNADPIPLIKPVALSPRAFQEYQSLAGTEAEIPGVLRAGKGRRPVPRPTQALAVKVLGIALVGGVPRAIIQSPDERISRTVAAGDRISNGLVLVRAIEANRSEPVVILEQFGQSVEAPIGGTAVALSPVSGDLPPLPPSQ
jgi:hypothetical protein